jgi:hypothetical protein
LLGPAWASKIGGKSARSEALSWVPEKADPGVIQYFKSGASMLAIFSPSLACKAPRYSFRS